MHIVAVGIFIGSCVSVGIGTFGLVLLILGIMAGLDYKHLRKVGDSFSVDYLIAGVILCGGGGFLLLVAIMGIGMIIYKGLSI